MSVTVLRDRADYPLASLTARAIQLGKTARAERMAAHSPGASLV